MFHDFHDLNAYVFHSAYGVVLDGVIWCLGPYVDDEREYGRFRICLAATTRAILRGCMRPQGRTLIP